MQVGDRVRITKRRNVHGGMHEYYGELGTVIECDALTVCVALDKYPNVNHRALKNRIWYWRGEVKKINDKGVST